MRNLVKLLLLLFCLLALLYFPPLFTSNKSIASSQEDTGYKEWQNAYNSYEQLAYEYWQNIATKRKIRNKKRANNQIITRDDYVLSQPPIYSGPAKPFKQTSTISKAKPTIPKIDDFINAAIDIYGFTPEKPENESVFMQAYVNAAQKMGFTREQIVAIYAFETGGVGRYNLQAGMLKNDNAIPISTAIGYNQLVATASVSLMWEYGDRIADALIKNAQNASPQDKKALLNKATIIKKMTEKAKSVPHIWKEQAKIANTKAGFAMHAMLLDKDVGPLLQIYKLKTTLNYLHKKGLKGQITGAELEMLNLTGDGNGYDMITLPTKIRGEIPTSNFFVRLGYERNAIANKNKTVALLLEATEKKIQQYMKKQGSLMLYNAF